MIGYYYCRSFGSMTGFIYPLQGGVKTPQKFQYTPKFAPPLWVCACNPQGTPNTPTMKSCIKPCSMRLISLDCRLWKDIMLYFLTWLLSCSVKRSSLGAWTMKSNSNFVRIVASILCSPHHHIHETANHSSHYQRERLTAIMKRSWTVETPKLPTNSNNL